jgi:hypothetical protein
VGPLLYTPPPMPEPTSAPLYLPSVISLRNINRQQQQQACIWMLQSGIEGLSCPAISHVRVKCPWASSDAAQLTQLNRSADRLSMRPAVVSTARPPGAAVHIVQHSSSIQLHPPVHQVVGGVVVNVGPCPHNAPNCLATLLQVSPARQADNTTLCCAALMS